MHGHGHPLLCQAGDCMALLPVQVQAFSLVGREISWPSQTINSPYRDNLLLGEVIVQEHHTVSHGHALLSDVK